MTLLTPDRTGGRPSPHQGTDPAPGLSPSTTELGVLFGGDYNPEQWDPAVWREDARLMQLAGVNLVTVGVFSWSRYEPQPGVRDFAWMDEVLDLLHAHGIAVDLATPTASPPPWLGHLHPDTLPVDADGVRLGWGSRNQFSPASRVYRDHALAITRDVVERYATHPAVRMWHVGNELGQVCHGEESAAAFREWLRERYGSLAVLNEAWGTAVWSQHYGQWEEITPPRRAPYHLNPTQVLDFRRYSSDALRSLFREQRDVIRGIDPVRPVTTNFMGFFPLVDYWSWADDLDVVADDAYPDPADPHAPSTSALTHDLMRSLGRGRPWVLMEQAAGAVSWRPHNLTKSPGRSRLESLQAVARGADAVCFFQWRAATKGPERFHSAMLPHAGPETRAHQGVRRLGADLARLRAVVGTRVVARVAVLFDWPSWWASQSEALPTDRLDALAQLRSWYRPLWEDGVAVDVARPGQDLSGYDVVLAPQLYLLAERAAEELRAHVARGGTLVLGPFGGVADESAHVRTGRFPALLRDVVGLSGEEWVPLPDDGAEVAWSAGSTAARPGGRPGEPSGTPGATSSRPSVSEPAPVPAPVPAAGTGSFRAEVLGELVRSEGAEVLASFRGGHLDGGPAITRHGLPGGGAAWYVATVPPQDVLAHVLRRALAEAGVEGVAPAVRLPGVEVVRRGDALFVLNHGRDTVRVRVEDLFPRGSSSVSPSHPRAEVVDLLTGLPPAAGEVVLAADDVVVLIERNS
ncbi:beta-galactosidase [Oerskovia enterophila]|uniref:beta-galactosidase n=1 Tax=Oerskovia enterophila TaxID=43678 RepID=A0ABX2Y4X1_9CELL|nr:beta-galactosidase [Oerskovia enterophila]OCI29951.1 beta-galactosidase bgaB [Oerskovia enterophila]